MPLKDNLRSRSPEDKLEERKILGGWIRQAEVRWLDPSILAKAGVEVAVSGTFGKFADKREIQTRPQGPFDYTRDSELWIDYLSDTGDGWAATQTMAWLLAQPSLPVDEEDLPRGRILLLGGDQVYPSATTQAYEDRFKGPFAAALPQSPPGEEPEMYATPGNHDWYDGLVSFLRLFCANAWIGGWRTRQRRSYFALQLPNKWWVWAIDIQLDTYIDDVQLEYFASQKIGPGDKIILMTAKPSWIAAIDGQVEPSTWKYLNFFEERMVRDTGARLALTVTGDRHHYARYEPSGEGAAEAPTRITAGGGGAYLSATHTLPERVELATLPRKEGEQDVAQPVVSITREAIYPKAKESFQLSMGILKLAALNPAFGRLLAALYALIGISLLGGVDKSVDDAINQTNELIESAKGAGQIDVFFDTATNENFFEFLGNAVGAMSIVLAVLLFGAIYPSVDIKQSKPLRLAVTFAHTFFHLLAIALVMWAAVKYAPDIWNTTASIWIFGILAALLVGATFGASLFGAFLWLVHWRRGPKAQANANQVFTGQSIVDYKNLLRMHLDRDGSLTIYALGVDKICRKWDLVEDAPAARFEPRGEAPRVHPIDRPLRFDPAGNRVVE